MRRASFFMSEDKLKFSSALIIVFILVSIIGFLVFVPIVAPQENKIHPKSFVETTREDFEKGIREDVQIKGSGDDAYLTISLDQAGDSVSDGQDSELVEVSEVFVPRIDEVRVLGGDNPSNPSPLNEIDAQKNYLKGKNSKNRLFDQRQRPDQITFFFWISQPYKNNEIAFLGPEGREGPVITTKVSRDHGYKSGMLMIDDGERGEEISGVMKGDWVEVRLEQIDYHDDTFDLKVKMGYKRKSFYPDWDVEKQDLPFKGDIDYISQVSYEVSSEGTMAWVPPRMIKFQYEKVSSQNSETTNKSNSSFTGTFESSTLDAYSDVENNERVQGVEFKQLNWFGDELDKIKIQIAHSSNGSDWSNFVGPDGTETSYYYVSSDDSEAEASATIDGHENYRFIKYKAHFMSGSSGSRPELDELKINYTVIYPSQTSLERDYVSYHSQNS